ncbi:MAG: hypothetical protein GF317_09395 [Candidatus Lokiarchaeota archaeon]|nr:hypothetical protein [Candidatus Lokiarchaeota archaeon]MBD3199926.1 hypothetical protein [Candidatus Lokiarchaeota archaeon]
MPWKEIQKEKILFDKKVQTFCVSNKFECPNYGHNWACPPEAPYLEDEIMNFEKYFLVYSKIIISSEKDTKEIEKSNSLNIQKELRDEIEGEISRFLKQNKSKYERIKILWDGHCRICSKEGKKCTYDTGESCRYPDKIRYSMEAVGIHVTKTVKKAGLNIEWPPKNHVFRFALISAK